MPKTKKPNKIHFGIEITKPHSKEMYAHNDKIAKELKSNILKAWEKLLSKLEDDDKWFMDRDWDNGDNSFPNLLKLQKNVCYSGYGDGYSVEMVNEEFKSELENMPNWQIHEVYAYCCFEGLVPRTKQGMVGFDWEKMNYWTDAIHDVLLGIGGDNLRGGPGVEDLYIKVYSQSEGDEIVNKLAKHNIEAYVDCYEADDGDEYPGGPPIILKFYSVKIKKS
tara:strand:- start:60 stop:722 length:663 start_codon:yes stop_codon:yes gene_type:complete